MSKETLWRNRWFPGAPGAPGAPAALPRWKAPITISDDFLTVRPSLEELFDQIVQNYCGFRRKSGGPYRSMDIDAALEFEDARFGCGVPLRIPFYIICRECGGSCISWGLCSACGGSGAVELANQVMLEIPPGARDGERYELNLDRAGIANLLLRVRIILN
jgi:DnaJ-class molecular chaperone